MSLIKNIPIKFIYPYIFLIILCFCQCTNTDSGSNENYEYEESHAGLVSDKKESKILQKPRVKTPEQIKWKALNPVIHPPSWETREKSELLSQKAMFGFSLDAFQILNSGAMFAKGSNSKYYVSNDDGANWHAFEPKLKNGASLSFSRIDVSHTNNFFVLETNRVSRTPKEWTEEEKKPLTYISYDGRTWENGEKNGIKIGDYETRLDRRLYRKKNPDVFQEIKETRPQNFSFLLYDLKDNEIAMYTDYDAVSKEAAHVVKRVYKVCDDNFVSLTNRGIYRGKSLSVLKLSDYNFKLEEEVRDHFVPVESEFSCYLQVNVPLRARREQVQMVLSNSSKFMHTFERFDKSIKEVFSSMDGKNMVAVGNGLLYLNENSLECICEPYE